MKNKNYNTTKEGNAWKKETIKKVFEKGKTIKGFSNTLWRHDKCDDPIKFSEFGNRKSIHGWEIDHINPIANKGGDELNNLQPLQWENNLEKGDNINWKCY
jgi:hypothetical protein|tara:strand:- start:152 stop:454 length:303 start_codon:yes stop_codon:yes gene_type:complete